MRYSQFRHSQATVIAKFLFSNDEMRYLAHDKNYIPKLKVSGTIATGLTIWFEARGNALRPVSPSETVGVVAVNAIKARNVSWNVRDVAVRRIHEDGENKLQMEPIPDLAEQFNPPHIVSKDMVITQAPRPGAPRPPLTGEALMQSEESRLRTTESRMSDAWKRKPAPPAPAPLPPAVAATIAAKAATEENLAVGAAIAARAAAIEQGSQGGIADLIAAIGMVNEVAERLPDVRLFVHENRITAKRERRSYEDLV